MTRYEPECVDGTLFLVAENDADDRVEIGALDHVVDAVGGDTYVIEYDDKQRMQPWLEADDGKLDVDVRETVTTLPHTQETVSELREYDMDTARYGLPTRTFKFADAFVDILERQGREDS
ncbi:MULTISPECIES: hypothetical protein [Halorussus]|uniref:hypothetical protein n=1 Tax=Halorussus TaxID=1070314 RepID=UPI00209DE18A|nr:hypothetical protein [Halorussus vallis]USZ78374.1 hypothetical protein NGM07_22905 [Halorussus vallis]